MQGTRCLVRTWGLLLHEAQGEPDGAQFLGVDSEETGPRPNFATQHVVGVPQTERRLQDVDAALSADMFRHAGPTRKCGYEFFAAHGHFFAGKLVPPGTDDDSDVESASGGDDGDSHAGGSGGRRCRAGRYSSGTDTDDSDVDSVANASSDDELELGSDMDCSVDRRRHVQRRQQKRAAAPSRARATLHEPILQLFVVRVPFHFATVLARVLTVAPCTCI